MADGRTQQRSIGGDPRARAVLYQALLAAALVGLGYLAWTNAVANMEARGVPIGFGFWNDTAGFDINQKLIPFSPLSTYGRAFWVGLANTLLVGAVSIVLATPLGFAIGLARLAPNWLLSRLALVYVEIARNTPLLLQLFFWYNAVLKTLPSPRQSLSVAGVAVLNNRGLYLPRLVYDEGAWLVGAALALALLLSVGLAVAGRRRQAATGERSHDLWPALALIVGLPVVAYFAAHRPIGFEFAALKGFNFSGGTEIHLEFAALTFGLVTYTAGFIAEIVRAGVMAVPRGQSEAAAALGLHRGLALRLVITPQALRLITPPLTSQYLNIVKNSSLAVFIGYPDLVLVFAGTVLNQTHAALQVMAVTMAVYLAISLAVSFALNLFNARNALKER